MSLERGKKPEMPLSTGEPNQDRRTFMRTVFGLALVGAGARAYHEVDKRQEPERKKRELENEKNNIRRAIDSGIEVAEKSVRLTNEYNSGVRQLKKLGKGDKEYKELDENLKKVWDELDKLPSRRQGSRIEAYLAEANVYAKKVRDNEVTLAAVATLFCYLKKWLGHESKYAAEYQHNLAAGYVRLEKISPALIAQKLDVLTDFFERKKIPKENLRQEDVLYYLIDNQFDWSLDAEGMEKFFSQRCVRWRETPATLLPNKKEEGSVYYYAHNNELSAFNVFELNRIRRVVEQIHDPHFKRYLFAERNRDLKERDTELGGLIPLPEQGKWLLDFVPEEKSRNNGYVNTPLQTVLRPAFLMEYHFHATQLREEDNPIGIGPSYGDAGGVFPSAVITSLNNKEIAVHIYVSRSDGTLGFGTDYYGKVDVVSLGVVQL